MNYNLFWFSRYFFFPLFFALSALAPPSTPPIPGAPPLSYLRLICFFFFLVISPTPFFYLAPSLTLSLSLAPPLSPLLIRPSHWPFFLAPPPLGTPTLTPVYQAVTASITWPWWLRQINFFIYIIRAQFSNVSSVWRALPLPLTTPDLSPVMVADAKCTHDLMWFSCSFFCFSFCNSF